MLKRPPVMKAVRPVPMHENERTSNLGTHGSNGTTHNISLIPPTILSVLGGITLCLIVGHVCLQLTSYFTGHPSIHGLVPLFDLDAEDNIPSSYSTLLLLFSSLLITITVILKKNKKGAMTVHWAVLAIGFFLMAADEEFSFHEELIEPVRAALGNGRLGFFYFAWVVPALVLVAVLGLFFLVFLIRLPRKTAWRFTLAGALFVGGCIGWELVGGRYDELHGQNNLTYKAIATLEESFEMTGVLVFIWALLDYMTETFGEVQISLIQKLNRRKD